MLSSHLSWLCSQSFSSATIIYKMLAGGNNMQVRAASPNDAAAIAHIYNQGIEDRVATFETRLRSAEEVQSWFNGVHPIVVIENEQGIIAFGSTSAYSNRECYNGIAECSVYVRRDMPAFGPARRALQALVQAATNTGF